MQRCEKKQEGKTPTIELDNLVETVCQFIAEEFYRKLRGEEPSDEQRAFWKGTFTQLAKTWGWEDVTAHQLSTAIRAIQDRLRDEHGIEILTPDDPGQRSNKERKITISYSVFPSTRNGWIRRMPTKSVLAKLLDDLPPGV